MNNLERALKVMGWEGGTIHQVAEKTGLTVEELLDAENVEDLLRIKLSGIALELAKGIIDYCGGGDAWERECNQPAMDQFEEIYNILFPREVEQTKLTYCCVCNREFIDEHTLRNHVGNSAVHAKKVTHLRNTDVEEYLLLNPVLRNLPKHRCEVCVKAFYDDNTYQQHMQSRRHAETLARAMDRQKHKAKK